MQGAPLAQYAIKRTVHKSMYDPAGIGAFASNLLSLLFETEMGRSLARATRGVEGIRGLYP